MVSRIDRNENFPPFHHLSPSWNISRRTCGRSHHRFPCLRHKRPHLSNFLQHLQNIDPCHRRLGCRMVNGYSVASEPSPNKTITPLRYSYCSCNDMLWGNIGAGCPQPATARWGQRALPLCVTTFHCQSNNVLNDEIHFWEISTAEFGLNVMQFRIHYRLTKRSHVYDSQNYLVGF